MLRESSETKIYPSNDLNWKLPTLAQFGFPSATQTQAVGGDLVVDDELSESRKSWACHLPRSSAVKASFRTMLRAASNFLLAFLEGDLFCALCQITLQNLPQVVIHDHLNKVTLCFCIPIFTLGTFIPLYTTNLDSMHLNSFCTLIAPFIPQMQLNLSPSSPRKGAGL